MERTISISELKARMLEVFRQIEANGEALIVTDHDRPILKIIPIGAKKDVAEVFGGIRGQLQFLEDINAPTLDEWDEV